MLKRLSVVLGVLICISAFNSVLGQAGAYSFSASSGSYTPLGATATSVPTLLDDGVEADVPIGFDFEFEGMMYDTVAAASDGFLSFVKGATSTATNNIDNGSSSRRPLVAPLWDDLDGKANASAAAYEVSGSAPNRVFTFEWSNWEWNWLSSDSVVSFQVKLYETSNIIEFTYKWECSSCVSSPSASIGISGANTFLSVTGVGTATPTASNNSEDSNIDTVVTDQVFTFTPPSCPQPTALSYSNPGVGTVDLDWTTGGASAWQISFDTTGSAPGANITGVTTAPPYNLSGLPTGVPVDIYVRDSCAVGDVSFWAGPITVSVPCGAQTAAYYTGFEGFRSGYDPICWSSYASSGSSEVTSSGTPRSGNLHLELDGTSSTNDTLLAISPQFSDLTANDKQIRFYAKTTDTDDTLFIGTLSALSPTATFTFVDTVVFSGNSYMEHVISLTTANGYNGSDEYVALMHSLDDGGSIYIDDFNYEVQPPCSKILSPVVTSVGVDTAVISFSNPGTSVDIEWGPVGFNQGTGCLNTVSVSNGSITIDNSIDPTCLNPLTENTCYDVYIRKNCSASGNGVSIWEGPITFCTSCGVQSLPYTEDFNSRLGCFTVLDSGTTNDTWFWAPASHSRGNLDGTGYMFVDSDDAGSVDMDEYAVSPVVDASSVTGQLILEFDQYFNSWSSENADVEVYDGTQWVTVLSQSSSDVGSWSTPDHQRLDLTAYANANFQVRFHYYNANYEYYWAIDNFDLYGLPCVGSSNLAAYAIASDSISLNWNPGQSSSFGIEYGPTGFVPGNGNLLSTTDTFITVNGLAAQNNYDFYIYDTCAAGYNPARGPLSIQTLCTPVSTLPFVETFNSSSTTQGCWTVLDVNADGDAWNLDDTQYPYEGDEAAMLNTDGNSGNNDDWLISPSVSLTGSEKLEYFYRVRSSFEPNDFEVLISTTGVNPADFTDTLVPLTSYSNTTYQKQMINLSAYSGDVHVAWHIPSGGLDGWRLYIDSVTFDALPPCPAPSQLAASNVQSFQVDLDWTDPSGNSWIIEWGPTGFQQGSGVGNVDTVSAHPFTLTGLAADSCYDVYVQNNCGIGGTSSWEGPVYFCTLPTCPAPTNLGATNLSSTSATLFWTSGGASDFNLEYGPVGFVPGSGTTVNVANDSNRVTGLAPRTCYEFYVRDSCAVGDVSTWSGPFAFKTFTTGLNFPVVEDFEAGFSAFQNPCNSNVTDWELDSNVVHGGNVAAHISYVSDDNSVLELAGYIDLSGTGMPVLSFWHIALMEGGYDEGLVEISTDAGQTYNPLPDSAYIGTSAGYPLNELFDEDDYPIWASGNNPAQARWYVKESFDLSAYKMDSVRVRFHLTSDGSVEHEGWYIDDIKINEPTCFDPLNLGVVADSLTATSSTVYWTPGGASNFNVQYDTVGFTLGTGMLANSTNDSLSLTGLNPDQCYEFYVRDSCGTGDVSDWRGPYSFCTPPTCPAPGNLGVVTSSITTGSADVFWTTGGSMNWNVEYGPTGFTPGTGSVLNASNDTLTLSGLSSSTCYEFYVRDSCGMGDVSTWVGPFNFCTKCNPAIAPYYQNFDGNDWVADNSGSAPNSVVGLCWTRNPDNGSDYSWRVRSTSTASSSTGPDQDYNGTGNFLYTEASSGSTGDTADLVSREVDLTGTTAPILAFAYHFYGATINKMYIDIYDGTSWTLEVDSIVGTQQSSSSAAWDSDTINISAFASNTIMVRFRGIHGSSYTGDMAIDEVYIGDPPNCTAPTALQAVNAGANSVDLSWTSGGASNWDIEYGPAGFTRGTGTRVSSTTNPYTLTGLSSNTCYEFYVRDSCGLGNVSFWKGPQSFRTLPMPLSFPVTEDFENGLVNLKNACDNLSDWVIEQNIVHGGSQSAKLSYVSNDNSILELEGYVDLTNTNTPGLTFWHIAKLEGGFDDGIVEISTDGGQTYSTLPVSSYLGSAAGYPVDSVFDEDDYSVWGTSAAPAQNSWWQQETFDLSSYKTDSVRIRFRFDSDGSIERDGWYLDDVVIDELLICDAPTNLAASVSGCDSVVVSWTSNAGSMSSHLEYGPVNFTPGTGTMVSNVSSPYLLTGLSLNTEYEVYVIDSCSATMGAMTGPASFKTDSLGPVLASFVYTQTDTTMNDATVDFDATASTGDGISYSWDFDGSTGSGMNASTQYTANGTYNVVLTVTDRCGQTDDTTITVTVGGISIVENAFNAEVAVYPNPNNGQFRLSVSNAASRYNVEVVDLTGKRIFAKEDIAPGTAEEIDMATAAPGVYFVRFTGEGLNVTQRVVIR